MEERKGKSKLVWQIVLFIVVFAAAFLATKYLGNHFLNSSKQKPATQSSTNK